jgi:membrane associated rhomboid family serine protease
VSQPPASGPGFTAPDFTACYRHPERMTGISCQRCKRPICGECMNPASVGFQCPRCVSSGKSGVRQPRTKFGAVARPGTGSTTYALMGVLAGVWLLDLVTRGLVDGMLIMSNQAVAGGQFWRLVTAALTSGGLLGTLMNLLVLWIAGRTMESELGRWRMLALFFAAGLGGTTLLFVFGPPAGLGYAASAAVIGLLAANSIFKYRQREDVRADLGLFVLLILYSVLVGFNSFGWLILVGGLLLGALVGAVLAYAPRQNRGTVQVVGLLGVIVLCLAAVTARLVLF